MAKKSKYSFIFPETPVRSTVSDVAEVEPIYSDDH